MKRIEQIEKLAIHISPKTLQFLDNNLETIVEGGAGVGSLLVGGRYAYNNKELVKKAITMLTHNFEGLADTDDEVKGNQTPKDISDNNKLSTPLLARQKNSKIKSNKLSRRLNQVNKMRDSKLNKSIDSKGNIHTDKEGLAGETSNKSDIITSQELSEIRGQSSRGLESGV